MTDIFLPADLDVLETDLLHVFCWVAKKRNFSRAADYLETAQPVITRKINRLEAQLGVQLFIRTNRGCELTQSGELLASKAPGILMQLAMLKEEVGHAAHLVAGPISFGITQSAGAVMVPYLLPAIASRWPLLRVNIVEALSKGLCEKVLNRELSFAVLYDPPPDPDLISTPLLMERLCLVGAPASGLPKRPQIADLVDLPLVLPSGQQTVRILLEDAFAEINAPLTPVYETNSINMLRSMALQGLGYTVLTLCSVADDVAAGKLEAVPFADQGMSIALSLISTREHTRLRNVQLLSSFVAAEIRKVAKNGLWPGNPVVVRPSDS